MTSMQTNMSVVRRGEPLSVNPNEEEISVLSWNVLADRHLQGQFGNNNPDYMHVAPEMLMWSHRSSIMIDEMRSSGADVICLQEIEETAFEKDFQPRLAKAGYDGLMQQQKVSGDGTKFDIGVATFWKRDKLHLTGECHRSRTMVTVFNYVNVDTTTQPISEESDVDQPAAEESETSNQSHPQSSFARYGIGVVNCHLQGRPDLTTTRVKQLQNSLKELKARFSHHAVMVVGDFNCCLQDSACSGYLAFGVVPQHQTEWGEPVPADTCLVPAHEYTAAQLSAAVLPSSSPGGDFTFCTLPHRTANGLDQIWYSSSSLELVGMRSHFRDDSEKDNVVNVTGMPCTINPSDHVPIASVFRWRKHYVKSDDDSDTSYTDIPLVDFSGVNKNNSQSTSANRTIFNKAGEVSAETPETVKEEALSLLLACPISDEERMEFESTLLPYEEEGVGSAKKKGKPSQAEIDYYQQQRLRKETLLNQVCEEAKQMLDAVMKLRRKAEKLQQQKLKNDRKKANK